MSHHAPLERRLHSAQHPCPEFPSDPPPCGASDLDPAPGTPVCRPRPVHRDSAVLASPHGRRPLPSPVLLTLVILLLGLGSGPFVSADDPQPGLDLFESPGPNFFPIDVPADFFGPGSGVVDDNVPFEGEPLMQFAGDPLGRADTIVRRGTPTQPLTCPGSTDIPIELVALNLVSTRPITVTFQSAGSELWDVRACVSYNAQSLGTLMVTESCGEGGMFDSTLTVKPRLIFTRVSDGQTEVLDPGPDKVLTVTAANWTHSPMMVDGRVLNPGVQVDGNCNGQGDDPTLQLGTSNFFPGIAATPCSTCNATEPPSKVLVAIPHESGDPMTDPDAAQHQVTLLLLIFSAIPTLGPWGLGLLVTLLTVAGISFLIWRR